MKRTSLMVDEQLLEEATRELGVKTYSAAVNYALKEVLRIRKVEGLAEFFGTKLWRGDLAKLHADRNTRKVRRRG